RAFLFLQLRAVIDAFGIKGDLACFDKTVLDLPLAGHVVAILVEDVGVARRAIALVVTPPGKLQPYTGHARIERKRLAGAAAFATETSRDVQRNIGNADDRDGWLHLHLPSNRGAGGRTRRSSPPALRSTIAPPAARRHFIKPVDSCAVSTKKS